MNFLPTALSIRSEAPLILVRRFALAGADAMAAELERGVLDGTLDSGGVDPNGGAGDCALGLIAFANPPGNGSGSAVRRLSGSGT